MELTVSQCVPGCPCKHIDSDDGKLLETSICVAQEFGSSMPLYATPHRKHTLFHFGMTYAVPAEDKLRTFAERG